MDDTSRVAAACKGYHRCLVVDRWNSMRRFSVIVGKSLGSGRFVVTSNCRYDIPVGTVFNRLYSEKRRYESGDIVIEQRGRVMVVSLAIAAVEFWRRPHDCVPYGHHAGIEFKADGVPVLSSYLAAHARPWSVFLDADSDHVPE